MCDCVGLCICLLASAIVSFYGCNECNRNNRLETIDKEPV